MDAQTILDNIKARAAEIGRLQADIKERSMIFDVSAKEALAKAKGLPLDAYYDLPYKDWMKIKAEGAA